MSIEIYTRDSQFPCLIVPSTADGGVIVTDAVLALIRAGRVPLGQLEAAAAADREMEGGHLVQVLMCLPECIAARPRGGEDGER